MFASFSLFEGGNRENTIAVWAAIEIDGERERGVELSAVL